MILSLCTVGSKNDEILFLVERRRQGAVQRVKGDSGVGVPETIRMVVRRVPTDTQETLLLTKGRSRGEGKDSGVV